MLLTQDSAWVLSDGFLWHLYVVFTQCMIERSLEDQKRDDMSAENVLAFSQVGKFDITNFNLGAKNQSFHSYFKAGSIADPFASNFEVLNGFEHPVKSFCGS